jgi:hypothetical protein
MAKAKGKASSAAPPKCTCDDPYTCTCGNRPPRPSRGHKWDPVAQAWGGKGHKQKGASGQTAVLGQQVQVTAVGKTALAQWQRLPSQLLSDYCQRQKRPPLKLKSMDGVKPDGHYKYRVIVKDPKNDEKDLFFVPSTAVPNEEQAKEEACLLALLHLTPELPHERKLPDPYKSTWLNALAAQKKQQSKSETEKSAMAKEKALEKPKDNSSKRNDEKRPNVAPSNSSTKETAAPTVAQASTHLTLDVSHGFTSKVAQRQANLELQKKRNARIRKHENMRLANQPHAVHLSAHLRQQIQAILRDESSFEWDDDMDGTEDQLMEAESDGQAYVQERLREEGFTPRQARTAYQHIVSQTKRQLQDREDEWEALYEECLQWLLITLHEDQLPEGFDPRGGTLEIIAPNTNNNKSNSSGSTRSKTTKELSRDQQAFASKYSLSENDALYIYEESKKSNTNPESSFFSLLLHQVHSYTSDNDEVPVMSSDECHVVLNDEIETLTAMYGSECNISVDNGVTTIQVPFDGFQLLLTVIVENDKYPVARPLQALVSGQWPSNHTGVALHLELVKHLLGIPRGEQILFALHDAVMTDLATIDELPSVSLHNVVQSAPLVSASLSQPSLVKDTPVSAIPPVIRRRPRERSSFWSVPPHKTPPAIAFPKISKSLEATRRSLPAYAARANFLSLLKKADQVCDQCFQFILFMCPCD